MNRAVLIALPLAACAHTPLPVEHTRDVLIPTPVACMTTAQRDALLALAPGAIGERPADARQREGVYLHRLSQYRTFADAVRDVLPGCVGG